MQFDQTLNTIELGKSKLVLSRFGGQIISWDFCGLPIIFENAQHAIKDLSTAYRGGAPICFPYFGKGTLLSTDGSTKEEITPQHGCARTSTWNLLDQSHSSVTLETVQPIPNNKSQADLRLTIQYSLAESDTSESSINIHASVENISSTGTFYQLAFHTYWNCENPSKIKVDGLGNEYLDNLSGLKKCSENSFLSVYPQPLDRVYLSTAKEIKVDTDKFQLKIVADGLNQAVAWNPGIHHTLKDVKDPQFFCVESGAVWPAPQINPLERHIYKLTYSVTLS